MANPVSPEKLAAFSTRRPWTVVAIWAVILVASVAMASQVGSVLTTAWEAYVETDSSRADDLLEERVYGGEVPQTELILVQSPSLAVDDPAFRSFAEGVIRDVRAHTADVANVTSYYETGVPALVSESGRTLLIPVTLTGDMEGAQDNAEVILETLHPRNGQDGFTVLMGGDGSIGLANTDVSEKDLQKAEIIGMPVALVILVFVFGALVAAGIPLIFGVVSIVVAVGLTFLLGQAFEMSVFVVNVITTMGLAVGIDYTLLVVQRFREERARGLDRDDAIIHAGATASRAVLFSGMAVVIALAGLLVVPQSIFRSLGIGAIIVVIVAVTAALTLLPASLRLLGDRVNWGRIPFASRPGNRNSGRFWDRTTRFVMRHPVISVALTASILIAASLPYWTIKLGFAGVSTLPADSEARQAFTLLEEEFSGGLLSPAEVVIDHPDVRSAQVQDAIARLNAQVATDSEFGPSAFEANPAGNLGLLRITFAGDPQSDAARSAVRRLRSDYIPEAFAGVPGDVYVTGATAIDIDGTQVIRDSTIPVFLFVLGLTFVILLVVFHSIVVPIKAIIMNLLSVGAAYGLTVLVFQHGVGNELLGFDTAERVESWVPLFMFAILFGLSMDYHVFLLTRIRERFEHTGDNGESVAYGVRTTAGMITGAALIMVAVFSGFAAGQLIAFQQMGFGLAVAVLLDATVVRSILVPASMELLGERNWYLPKWLAWLPKVDVEGSNIPAPTRTPDYDPHLHPETAPLQ
ncbi:MAG: MMPL family transporter [Dehalococcoidia bacterium]|nr:MMPL family transporter [Dehalococcoidia bacterium]